MEEIKDYSFTKKEFRQMEKLADYIYNIAVVLDYFCSTQREIEELYNLTPIIKDLRRQSDTILIMILMKMKFNHIILTPLFQSVQEFRG